MTSFFRGILVWLSRNTPVRVLSEPMGICDVVGSCWMHWSCTDRWRRKIASCFSIHPWQSAVGRKVLHETTKSSRGEQGVTKKAWHWTWPAFTYCILLWTFLMCSEISDWSSLAQPKYDFDNANSHSLYTCWPLVPSPENSPMPANAASQELKCRLFSLYLRPWVLDDAHSSAKVPHLKQLIRVPQADAGEDDWCNWMHCFMSWCYVR